MLIDHAHELVAVVLLLAALFLASLNPRSTPVAPISAGRTSTPVRYVP